MFTLTTTAAQQIQKAAQDSGAANMALRVAARRMSDGSIDYGMGFDEVGENDARLLLNEVPVVIAAHHADLLENTVLDFVEIEPGEFNFIFANVPTEQASTSAGGCASKGGGGGCGSGACGSSGSCGTGGARSTH